MADKAGITHHVTLSTHSGGTLRGLMLAKDADGGLDYNATLQPQLPIEDSVVRQDSWHLGFGDYLARPNDPYRYAYTDGIDPSTAGEAHLANQFSTERVGWSFRNITAEAGASPSPFANTLTTESIETTIVREGTNSWKMVSAGSAGWEHAGIPVNTVNGNLNGTTVTFYVWVYTADANVKAYIFDGDATLAAGVTVVGAAHPRTSTWRLLSVEHTLANTNFYVGVVNASGTPAVVTYYIDGAWIKYSAAATAMTPIIGPISFEGAQYAASGSVLFKWITADSWWKPNASTATAGDGNAITALAVHGGNLYTGTATSYFEGSGPNIMGTFVTGDDADLLLTGTDKNGDTRLFRVDQGNSIYVSKEDPVGTGVSTSLWEAALFAGTGDHNIGALFGAFDSVLVGKSDGLYYYYSPDDKFRPATEQARLSPNAENFDKGAEYTDGWFYTTTARHGLVRIRFEGGDALFQPVPTDYQADMYDRFGGRVRSLATDGEWLYGIYDQPTADTSSLKRCYLIKGHYEQNPQGDNRLVWHTLKQLPIGVPGSLYVDSDYVWAAGLYCHGGTLAAGGTNTEYEQTMFRMKLATQHENMRKEVTPAHELTGTLVTGIFDLDDEGFGLDDKAMLKIIVYGENVSATKTITVEYQSDTAIDDTTSGTWTAVGAAITALTNNAAIVAFSAGSTSKRFRLRFTLASTVATSSPVLRAFRVHMMPHPDRVLFWQITVRVQTGDMNLNGVRSTDTAKSIWADLQTLYAEDFPILFADIDGTQYKASIIGLTKSPILRRSSGSGGHQSEHIDQAIGLLVREVKQS